MMGTVAIAHSNVRAAKKRERVAVVRQCLSRSYYDNTYMYDTRYEAHIVLPFFCFLSRGAFGEPTGIM